MNLKDLKIGSIVRLTGKVVEEIYYGYEVKFEGLDITTIVSFAEMEAAELIAPPEPTCTREFAEAVKKARLSYEPFNKWLDEHTI